MSGSSSRVWVMPHRHRAFADYFEAPSLCSMVADADADDGVVVGEEDCGWRGEAVFAGARERDEPNGLGVPA